MYSYPIWLLLFIILPLVLLWVFAHKTLRKHARLLGFTALGCLAVSVPWDILSVQDGIWYFTEPHILGVWVLGLPIEEYVYIVGVGLLACIVTLLLWERYGKAA